MLRGELQPGTWLRQDDLAARLGVSKIPVREALHRLAASGLLSFESNRGAVMRALSADAAEEIYHLRMAIEPMLLGRSVERMSIVDFAEAEFALAGEGMSLTEANWAFHRALYAAGGWSRGMAMVETLHASVAPYVVLYAEGLGGAGESDEQHAVLFDLCRNGDTEAACELLVVHLRDAAAALIDSLASGET